MTVTRFTLVTTGADGTIGRSLRTHQDLTNTKDQVPSLVCGDLSRAIIGERHLIPHPGSHFREIDLFPEENLDVRDLLPRENMRKEKVQV